MSAPLLFLYCSFVVPLSFPSSQNTLQKHPPPPWGGSGRGFPLPFGEGRGEVQKRTPGLATRRCSVICPCWKLLCNGLSSSVNSSSSAVSNFLNSSSSAVNNFLHCLSSSVSSSLCGLVLGASSESHSCNGNEHKCNLLHFLCFLNV